MSERSLREQIARIIHPWAFRSVEDWQRETWCRSPEDARDEVNYYEPERSTALTRTDEILALLDAARAEGGAGAGFNAEEFREWFRVVRTWSGSAFLAGEKVADEAEHKSQLYSDLCSLGNYLDCWADIAEAQASGLAAGTHQPPVQQPRDALPPPAADVEGLVERLTALAGEYVRNSRQAELLHQAATALRAEHARGERLEQKWWDSAVELKARAETAERRLEEVVGALEMIANYSGLGSQHPVKTRARQALSAIQSGEGGISAAQGSGTSSAPPFANHTHQPSTEGAASQEGR